MPTLIDLPEIIAAGLTESTKEVFADVSAEEIRDKIKVAIEVENLKIKANI